MRFVVVPQAMRAMAPAIASQLIVLLKDTSLGALVSYEELLRRAQITDEFARSPLQALAVAPGRGGGSGSGLITRAEVMPV